jgi:hypothetical protein
MPMDRSLYPKDWDAIARSIKDAADWKCQQCDRPCRRPGETREQLEDRIRLSQTRWAGDLYELEDDDEFGAIEVPKLGRFTLTVAHLNHQPADCRPENLMALCSVCHCRMDIAPSALATKRALKLERQGQLRIDF